MVFASLEAAFGVKCINLEADQVQNILIALNISSVTSGFLIEW